VVDVSANQQDGIVTAWTPRGLRHADPGLYPRRDINVNNIRGFGAWNEDERSSSTRAIS